MTEFQTISTAAIEESKLNPRRTFDKDSLEELAASIREKGVLQPILVRPKGGAFELVAGARRYRASVIAGNLTIPAMVRELDDKQVLEIMVIENAQRADVHPLEEADAFQALIGVHGHDPESIAARIGKTVSYVRGRLLLTNLEKLPRAALLDGILPLGHAQLIARLKPDLQPAAIHACRIKKAGNGFDVDGWAGVARLSDLKNWITREAVLHVKHAKWALDDAALLPQAGPCTTCPKRTGVNVQLFPELEHDVCTDRGYWNEKEKALLEVRIQEAREKGVQLLSLDYSAKKKSLPEGVLHSSEWSIGFGSEARQGLCIDGYRAGEFTQWLPAGGRSEESVKLEEKRKAEEQLQKALRPAILAAIASADMIKNDPAAALTEIARAHWQRSYSASYQTAAAKALGIPIPKSDRNGKQTPNPGAALDGDFPVVEALAVIAVASEVVQAYGEPKALNALAKALGVDVAGIRKRVKADLDAKAKKGGKR